MKKTLLVILGLVSLLNVTSVNAKELNCNYIYKKGNVHSEIKTLQTLLNEQANCNLAVDGKFGSLTHECVVNYQRANNITADGYVRQDTCKRLNARALVQNSPVVAEKKVNCSYVYKYGSKGENVKVLQEKLNKKENCNLEIDGSFGPLTQACVKKYQTNHNLVVDGSVGPLTCNSLNDTNNNNNSNNDVINNTTPATTSGLNTNQYYVNAAGVNIRTEPRTSAQSLGQLKQGARISVSSFEGNWAKVKYDSQRYVYISRNYLSQNVIIVDISDQMVYYFKDRTTNVLTAPIVSGKQGAHATPEGKFILKASSLERQRYLKGTNDDGTKYNQYVEYWMPFNGGVGFHDASWRKDSDFNSQTYINNGSHGCINMKAADAKKLFENIKEDTVVIVRK